MKIEVGKLYKTRNGLKVRIYAIDGGFDAQRIHGAHQSEGIVGWAICSWRDDGLYYPDSEHDFDIVDYWPEQPEESSINSIITPSAAVRQEILRELMHFYNTDSGLDSHPLYRDRPTKWENQ